jgi:NCAIR mutase (PurE)-related protein
MDSIQKTESNEGYIAIICAGTSDFRVTEEAAKTAEVLDSNVHRFYDV